MCELVHDVSLHAGETALSTSAIDRWLVASAVYTAITYMHSMSDHY
jgi:hypothetical protein